jgi:hypothetical protein
MLENLGGQIFTGCQKLAVQIQPASTGEKCFTVSTSYTLHVTAAGLGRSRGVCRSHHGNRLRASLANAARNHDNYFFSTI